MIEIALLIALALIFWPITLLLGIPYLLFGPLGAVIVGTLAVAFIAACIFDDWRGLRRKRRARLAATANGAAQPG
jgi:uncharacterized membrane protein YccC